MGNSSCTNLEDEVMKPFSAVHFFGSIMIMLGISNGLKFSLRATSLIAVMIRSRNCGNRQISSYDFPRVSPSCDQLSINCLLGTITAATPF
jgi:hypothetical protein